MAPLTSATLVASLRQNLRWDDFVALYGPWIVARAGCNGLQPADREDILSKVLVKVWRGIHTYDSSRGRFHHWLAAVVDNAVRDLRQELRKQNQSELPDEVPDQPPGVMDADTEQFLLRMQDEGLQHTELQGAVDKVRTTVGSTTWRAFLLFVFLDLSAKDIAPRLRMTPAAVHQAVYRVRQLLGESVQAVKKEELP